jgi:endoglucanase
MINRSVARVAFRTIATLAAAALVVGALAACTADTPSPPAPAPTSTHAPTSSDSASESELQKIFPGGLWTNPDTLPVLEQAKLTMDRRFDSAQLVSEISSQPIATWLGDWWSTSQLKRKLHTMLSEAEAKAQTPVFVLYAIPDRDCGGFSAGGFSNSEYARWVAVIAKTLTGHRAVVLVEPDSLAMLSDPDCADQRATRPGIIANAARELNEAGATVYLDAGNSRWLSATTMAKTLKTAGIQYARGFFTNVAVYNSLKSEQGYGSRLSALLGGKHYVVDVSRNGNGHQEHWCNSFGAALGPDPAVADGTTALDATLWVKTPGASDGSCNGGPPAGKWYAKYAYQLINAR